MGGAAFASGPSPLNTPRMPSAVYARAKNACHALLRHLFVYVASPIEGPGKTDHGDIDILVALDRRFAFPQKPGDGVQRSPQELMAAIQDALDTRYAIVDRTAMSANFAILWPEEGEEEEAEAETEGIGGRDNGNHDEKDPTPRHIQVDVRICNDLDDLCWALFKHAHGDLWNLLGSTIRPYGLTVDEQGLWLRIPEIEKLDRKRAKVLLTSDPVATIHFLGMQVEGFWAEPFESVDALFDYVTTCRLFWVQPASEESPGAEANEAGSLGGEEGRKKLKSNDRRRMNYRAVYRRWIDEFIPQLRAEGRFASKYQHASVQELRDMVRDEAFARFFVETEYRARLWAWRVQREAEQVKGLVKELIPMDLDPHYRACLVGGMRKIVMEDDRSLGIIPEIPLKDADGFYDMEATRAFVARNWGKLGPITWSMQLQKSREHLSSKQAKELKKEA
ncbi:hypothetical protein B0T19DRAFT_447922 [Cercophora scortea]|uniref:Nucleotidyltransferase n=1 Tax=Cercophora scortea TaxID=314031 RepID=A0AAE0J5N4_9PEZI|nr:hypothetical protein B0T19DRAFT_447922 [Cercophora scortea]